MRLDCLLLPLVGACALLSPMSALADTQAQALQAIQTAYARVDAAFQRKDIAGLTAYYTPDRIGIDEHGKQTSVAEEKQQMQNILPSLRSGKARTTVRRITLKGKQALVYSSTHIEGVLVNPQTKETIKMVSEQSAQSTWVKDAHGWREKISKILSQKTTQKTTTNGKAVP